MTRCYWDQICSEWRTTGNSNVLICFKKATHWMEIPRPPTAEKASEPHVHVWAEAPDSGLALCACGDYSDDWYCPESADHVCHYRNGNFDQCDFCGQPEERK
jgi:hypothetical protein